VVHLQRGCDPFPGPRGPCRRRRSKMKNLLVFDFGGGTLDVTIMEIESGTMNFKARPPPSGRPCASDSRARARRARLRVGLLGDPEGASRAERLRAHGAPLAPAERTSRAALQVRATDGDTRLGGEDIDARLVNHFLQVRLGAAVTPTHPARGAVPSARAPRRRVGGAHGRAGGRRAGAGGARRGFSSGAGAGPWREGAGRRGAAGF
jgi:hypothetical protein